MVVTIALAVVTWVFRGIGPAVRRLPDPVVRWTRGLAPFLLAALVASEVGDDGTTATAVAVAAVPIALRAPPLVAVAVGAAAAALLRAAG